MFYFDRLIILVIFFLLNLNINAQERAFSPQLWLNNSKEIKSIKQSLSSLNNNGKLYINAEQFNSSLTTINDMNQLFVVYRSKNDENILAILGKDKSLFLNSNRLKINDSIDLTGYNGFNGELLDVKFSGIEKGKFWMNPKMKETDVYEIILYNNKAEDIKINEIRTYLSIKYGIDLIDYKQYEYNGVKLWDDNSDYNYNIFGLAKFSTFNLHSKTAVHSKDQDFIITLNQENKRLFKDGSFILFGNNNKSLNFNNDKRESAKKWKVKTNLGDLKVDISVPISKLGNNLKSFDLIVEQNNFSKVYKGILKDSSYIYKNVTFTNDHNAIVKLKESISDVEYDITNTCNEFAIKFSKLKKNRSYNLTVKDDKGKIIISKKSTNPNFSILNPKTSFYDITLQYDQLISRKRVDTYQKKIKIAGLKKEYYLENGKTIISVFNNNQNKLEWFKGNVKIGSGNNLTIESAGEYSVNSIGEGNCFFTENFSVKSSTYISDFTIYPNPLSKEEDLNIVFNLDKEKLAELSIYTLEGKILKQFELGKVQKSTINLGKIIGATGTYMVVVYLDKSPQFQKIIIK